jgi:hypothetical protein
LKDGSEALEATLELVRAADPLNYPEGEQPDTEAALRVMLVTVPVSRSRRARDVGVSCRSQEWRSELRLPPLWR